MESIKNFIAEHWRSAIEILILAAGVYQIFRAFKATRGARILVGLASILIFLTLISQLFSFQVIGWIITRAAAALALALIVIPVVIRTTENMLQLVPSALREAAIFSIFRRTAENPLYRIEKRPALRGKQGMWTLFGEAGQVLKRGHELAGVLFPLERRLVRLVEA